MDKTGRWSLSPAYDVTWSFDPGNKWLSQHQMAMNGKRDGFVLADFEDCARTVSINSARARAIVQEVRDVVADWPRFAEVAQVDDKMRLDIDPSLRLML